MADEKNKIEDAIGELGKSIGEVKERVQNLGSDLTAKVEAGGEATAAVKEEVDKALSEFGDLQTRLGDLEKKRAREREDGERQQKSLGQLVVESEAFKNSNLDGASRGTCRVKLERADITSAPGTVGSNTSGSNSLVSADRRAGIIAPPNRTMTIRDLVMPGTTGSSSIEYVRETGFTNNAGMVSEGTTKPKSEITFELENAPVRTIAHIFKASRQILDDAQGLQSYIDGRARYGLMFKEEGQLLNGDGTGQNLSGLTTLATDYTGEFDPANPQRIDILRLALLQVILAEYPSNGFVLNPIDWAQIELTKDTQGRYIIGSPQDGTSPRLWNLPVVETQAMGRGDFLTGAFNMAAQIFDRMEIEVLLSSENVDDFERNMFTIRAEERLAFAIYRPEAFVYGEFDAALSDAA